jgi:hypothetical protein
MAVPGGVGRSTVGVTAAGDLAVTAPVAIPAGIATASTGGCR